MTEPLLAQLDCLAAGVAERTVYTLVADVIAALGLFDAVARWPDGEQARANLLKLLAEAAEFMDANREALAYGGFHGSGVQTFLAWLAVRVELKDGDKQPEPRVLDEESIVLTTWHSSKGREWPVVVVCGLDREVGARLPDLGLGYATFDELSRLLDVARIEYAPNSRRRRRTTSSWLNSSRSRRRKRDVFCTWHLPAHATSWCSSGLSILPAKTARPIGRS